MKVILLKNNLKIGLETISRSISENSSLPILKTVLVKNNNNKICLLGTNLELAVTSKVAGKIIEEGELAIPFGVFSSIINNLDSDRVNLEKKNKNLIIKTDNYSAVIQGMEPSDFPIIPSIENKNFYVEIQSEIFKDSLSKVIHAAQTSDFRPELNGVLFDFQINAIKLAATDSFRLAEVSISKQQFKTNYESGFKVIIPIKTGQEILRILKDGTSAKLCFDSNQMVLKTDDFELISRLTEGSFPDYEQIIPKKFGTEILLQKDNFVNAIKLSSAFTTKISNLRFRIEDGKKAVEVYSADSALGENTYIIPAKIKGEVAEVGFNWRFLMDGIKAMSSEDVFFGINGENKPAMLKNPEDNSYFYVIMPIKSA
ncbi:DNA polymerase III subunit beta [Candidatus Wolfebacteria bacterium RIFCSPLOWO2_01_FULL_45_19]|uniref:Beta sliding clamp n=1 Tax=Candidatus Wolfebacteria bacterium RIFCSPLOWO2_01_FULL_45_19 TaxID=1802557 RepID=A0A1F8DS50_9BACT|nr:MAG: polymerase III subunit beta protein [Parcubacteria group bacterium GW2011_GWB1_45_9]OGM91451.1 MAG: DNA polymerase III subunit beta [Candidatus Wolfebacteria bacterium RIFCSPLOWO2_01_FULL_45_19]